MKKKLNCVLLIDDNESDNFFHKRVIEKAGITDHVEIAENGNFSKPSTFFLTNGAYFRFKTIQLGYTFPKAIVSKIGLQLLRIYVTANNLFTITKYKGFDPEIGGASYGIDRGVYPQARSFMIGLTVTI